jgi:hypothetical protein
MAPQRSGRLTYWHAGGAIETRSGPISLQRANALRRFFADEAAAAVQRSDLAVGDFCAGKALEIAHAVIRCESWRRSAGC